MELRITKVGIEKSGDDYIAYAAFVYTPSFMRGLWQLWCILSLGIFSGKILLYERLGELEDIDEHLDYMQIAYDLYPGDYRTTKEEAELLETRYAVYFRSKGIYSPRRTPD